MCACIDKCAHACMWVCVYALHLRCIRWMSMVAMVFQILLWLTRKWISVSAVATVMEELLSVCSVPSIESSSAYEHQFQQNSLIWACYSFPTWYTLRTLQVKCKSLHPLRKSNLAACPFLGQKQPDSDYLSDICVQMLSLVGHKMMLPLQYMSGRF